MRNIKASSRYAKALITEAIKLNKLEEVHADMISLHQTIEGSKKLNLVLESPIINPNKKKEIIKALFEKSITQLSLTYFDLIIEKKRANLLSEIANQFINQYNIYHNILNIEITTAIKLEDKQKEKIVALIKHDGKINTTEKINSSLIGGFIVKVGDKQIDASIAARFKELRKEIILN